MVLIRAWQRQREECVMHSVYIISSALILHADSAQADCQVVIRSHAGQAGFRRKTLPSAPAMRTGAATARSMVSALWQAGQRAGPTHAPVYSTAHARQNVCPHAAPTASCGFHGLTYGGMRYEK